MGLKEALPTVEPTNKRAAWLLAGFTLVAAAFAVVGIKTDELANVWRNESCLAVAGVICVFAAVAIGAIAGWVLKEHSRVEFWLLILGNILLGAGLIAFAVAGLRLASDRSEPTITANPSVEGGRTTLAVTVENTKLSADDDLAVKVEPLFEIEDEDGGLGYRVGRPFYAASLGPTDNGDVKRTVEVEIPAGKFEDVGVQASVEPSFGCYEDLDDSSCVVVHVPQRTEEPQLTFRWRRLGRAGAALRVHVTAMDIAGDSLHFLAKSVRPRARVLAEANLGPDLNGDVDHGFVMPVKGARLVCVVAGTAAGRPSCPPRDRESVTWARLRVPARK